MITSRGILAVVSTTALFATTGSATAPGARGRYIVELADSAQGRAALQAAGGSIALELPRHGAVAAYLPEAAVSALARHPAIGAIEEDAIRVPLSTQVSPYGIAMVQADQLHDAAAGNATVCIIDSGYNLGHEDLPANVTSSPNSGTGNPFVDSCNHGTHVAGTVAALNNDRGVVGVLPNGNINLHIVKVFGGAGSVEGDADCGWAYSSDLVLAIEECQSNAIGNLVISMSLGGDRKNRFEEQAFDAAHAANVLSVAAAGNDGNTRRSYPASYASVVSVAAVDAEKNLASFSQRNPEVELAAPGVGVESTMPTGQGTASSAVVGGTSFAANAMEGSPNASGTGPLTDCGLGTSDCAGGVCLIARGDITFADKVLACEAGGGVAAIIYNNEPGALLGTLGDTVTSIPSVGVSDTAGADLLARLGDSTTVTVAASNYGAMDGTSMATPHVSGVAALVWSHAPSATNQQLRDALAQTAEDLGSAGRDDSFGYGLVQALDATLALGGDPTPTDDDGDGYTTVDGDCDDSDASVNPGAAEVSCDGIDNNCDGVVDEVDDVDGDGYTTCGGPDNDCNDGDAAVNPGATDICGQTDMNCDGVIDACPTTATFAYVEAIDMHYLNKKGRFSYSVRCAVTIHDDFGAPVSGATVDFTLVSASGAAFPTSGSTGTDGSTAEFGLNTAAEGEFSCSVQNVTHPDLSYDPVLNNLTVQTLQVP